ncbi:BglG family transcription antiterminator [Rubrobacter indicoceani]|uniref:BglG family transcription antiterminator n=1 Tax=Rubrobacter indicoceani TaxID=2051957 RepID=UPI000E5A7725|nr:BglG family transcription antiterminator [Rubrobacter indicoceani]
MAGLSTRDAKLVEALLRRPEGLTASDLAAALNVSARTVHRDLAPGRAAEDFLRSHGLTLTRQSGRGLAVEGEAGDIERAIRDLGTASAADVSPDKRRVAVLVHLLRAGGPVKLRAIASGLNVAVGTASRDLDDAEVWLEDFRLTLVRRRGYGVEIVGSESERRRAMSRLVFENLDESELLPGLEDHTPEASRRLLGLVDPERLRTVERLTREEVGKLPYSIADEAFAALVVHVALMAERAFAGGRVEMSDDLLSRLSETGEYPHAANLAHRISERFSVAIPEPEVGYVTLHLRGTKLRQDYALEQYFATSDLEVASRVRALIRYMEDRTGVVLGGDGSLYTGLLAHLERALYRVREGMRIYNPLLEDVKRDYPALFALVDEAMRRVFLDSEVPAEEVGFVAMHFGAALDRGQGDFPRSVLVICSSGIATSKVLASRLEAAFPRIRHVRNASVFELPGIEPEDFDLVVSTVLLPLPEKAYVQVRPFVTEREIEEIRSHLLEKNLTRRVPSSLSGAPDGSAGRAASESLEVFGGGQERFHQMVEATQVVADLMDDFFLAAHVARGDESRAVWLMCGSLEERGLAASAKSLAGELTGRAERGGIGIPGTGLALFHARDGGVPRPSFSVHQLDVPLVMEGMDGEAMRVGRALLMVAPLDMSAVALETVSEISAAMVERSVARETFERGDEEAISSVLRAIFSQYLQDRLT